MKVNITPAFVLALYPAFGIGQLARTYMVNLLIWNAWGIIYAVMSQMLTILNADSLTSILTAQNFGGAFQGASEMVLISLSSILLSLMIALIPFIAKRIVSGDDLQHQRGIAHGAGHWTGGILFQADGHVTPARDQCDGRLDAENAAETRRDADRAAAIAAKVQPAHAGRRRHRRAAG